MHSAYHGPLFLALGLLATACSTSPTPITSVGPSVTETYEGSDISDATQKASDYCKARGLQATLRITMVKDGVQTAIFDCH